MLKLIPPRTGRTPYWAVRGTYMGRHVNLSTRTTDRHKAWIFLVKVQERIEAGDGLTWKKIPGFSRYEISDNGQVKRLPAILKQTPQPTGHLLVTVYSDGGKQWRTSAHQLVARAFLGDPPPDKPYACHKDGNPANNQPGNLYWGSAADNAADAVRHASLRKPRILARSGISVERKQRPRMRTRKYVYQQPLRDIAT